MLQSRNPRKRHLSFYCMVETPETVSDYKTELVVNLSDARALAHEHIAHAQRHQKRQYDKRSREVMWHIGDRVMVHIPGTICGKAWKFARTFYDPYRVVAVTPTNAEVQLVEEPSEASINLCIFGSSSTMSWRASRCFLGWTTGTKELSSA